MINTVYQQEPSPTKLARQGSNLPVFETTSLEILLFFMPSFLHFLTREMEIGEGEAVVKETWAWWAWPIIWIL